MHLLPYFKILAKLVAANSFGLNLVDELLTCTIQDWGSLLCGNGRIKEELRDQSLNMRCPMFRILQTLRLLRH